ncbi:MAG TPA: mechanosensitive ion channel domain-containing protein [Actinopolymorphaceae bacterium]
MIDTLLAVYQPVLVVVLAVAVAFGAVSVGFRVARRMGSQIPLLATLADELRRPTQALAVVLAARISISAVAGSAEWLAATEKILLLGAIGTGGWLVGSFVLVLEDAALARFRTEDPDNIEARRARTQVLILRRLSVALIAVLTVGIGLTTFEAVRTVGASLLASAGLAGVIAGLAAQSTLGNLFAGLQLVFGDALRVDDVVVVEGEWGRVEEVTLGYVVVNIWDERRLILPTSYFTTTPYRHWSRRGTQIMGTAELERFCRDHPSWDGRSVSLAVTEATGSLIRVRAVVSAADSSELWNLRCAVREHLVEWVRTTHPEAIPRVRSNVAVSATESAK